MRKINLLVFSLSLLVFVACSKNIKTDLASDVVEVTDNQEYDVTLNIQENLTVNEFDGKVVNWPPFGVDSVQIPSGNHVLSCSYHVTQTTGLVTTQQSANKILIEKNFEKGKTYSLTYTLSGDNVTLQLEEAPTKEKTEATSTTQEPAQESEGK